MAADLAGRPNSDLYVQLCGDAHLSNFGVFSSPERRLVFDINAFDETLPGPFEWDVKRLCASIEVAGRDRGFTRDERRRATKEAAEEYRQAMREFAGMRDLDVWYAHIAVEEFVATVEQHVTRKQRKIFDKNMEKARKKDSRRALEKLTTSVNGPGRIVSRPPLIVPIEELVGPDEQGL